LTALESYEDGKKPLPVDVIIPVYSERSEVLTETLSACLKQTYPISKIFVVDDGSPEPVSLPDWAKLSPRICLLRLPQNQGISAARNAAIARSNAPLLACVNTEVLPDPDWLSTCESHLTSQPNVGACYTRIVPENPKRILSRWRMRFLESKFGEHSSISIFAPGHAVLFRREAIERVGGYDTRLRRIMEDSDICERMRQFGWETYYVAHSRCVSIQKDLLTELCKKQLVRSGWTSPTDYSFRRLFQEQCKWLLMRIGRNIVKGRLLFVPIDCSVWFGSLCIAVPRYLGLTGPRAEDE
jgi:cellulose synthase/poly-beta-1,6-N-acetylglucosamine synthase-like glycosyltransferase